MFAILRFTSVGTKCLFGSACKWHSYICRQVQGCYRCSNLEKMLGITQNDERKYVSKQAQSEPNNS